MLGCIYKVIELAFPIVGLFGLAFTKVCASVQGVIYELFNIKSAVLGAYGIWQEKVSELRAITRNIMIAGLAVLSAFKAVCATAYMTPEHGVRVAACRLLVAATIGCS